MHTLNLKENHRFYLNSFEAYHLLCHSNQMCHMLIFMKEKCNLWTFKHLLDILREIKIEKVMWYIDDMIEKEREMKWSIEILYEK